MKFAEDLTGFNEDDRELIVNYTKALETGTTRDHCRCEWQVVDTNKWLRKSVSFDCPVHTREGFLLGFLTYTQRRLDDEYHYCDTCGKQGPKKFEGNSYRCSQCSYMVSNSLPIKPVRTANVRLLNDEDEF